MTINLNSLTRQFILSEGKGPNINSWIQALSESLAAMKPRTVSQGRRIEVMNHQLSELRRAARRMTERINVLEEQVHVLEEENKNV